MADTIDTTTNTASGPYAQIVAELRSTFRQGHTRPLAWRKAQLEGLLRMLIENEDEFVRALATDLGRPRLEAFAADLGVVKVEIKHILKHLDRWAKPRKASLPITSQPGKATVVPEPFGVVLVIAPWNYPVQLLLNPMAAALSAGNCVVAKPSELAPACSAVLARLLPRYVDDSAVVVVEGAVPETTALLEQHFDHIFFTGSTAVGKVVMAAAAKHLTPVVLELGGKSPVIVAADADLEVAARRIVWGKFLNAGQTCIAPDYVLAHRVVRDRLVEHMINVIAEFYGLDPARSDSLCRIVNGRHLKRLQGLLTDHGGTVVTGGDADPDDRYLAPTIVIDPDLDSPLMQNEIFGPILPVLSVESVDDAIEFIVDRPKPLALYLFSSATETVERVMERTSSGGVCINHVVMHYLPNELPFGGVGASGMGAYHGQSGFEALSHLKSVLRKPTRPDPRLLYPPYTSLKEKVVKLAM